MDTSILEGLVPFARISHHLKKNEMQSKNRSNVCITFKSNLLRKLTEYLPIKIFILATQTKCIVQEEALRILAHSLTEQNDSCSVEPSNLHRIWSIKKDRAFIELESILPELKGFWLCLKEEKIKQIDLNEIVYLKYYNAPVYTQSRAVGTIKNYLHNGAHGIWVIESIENIKKEVMIPDIPEFIKWDTQKNILEINEYESFL